MGNLSRRDFLAHGASFGGCATLFFSRQNSKEGTPDITGKKLEGIIPQLLIEHRVPGLQIALVKNGRVSWSQGFGVKEIATQKPVTSDTVFELASLSKSTFAYAVLKLADKGLIELDAPLTRYLPEPFIPNEPRLLSITARMILSHTSGLPHSRQGNRPLSLLFDPGKRFYYSPTGFDYLQKVVCKISQQSLERLMKETVLDPFSMVNSNFGWQESFGMKRAIGYNSKGEPGETFNEKYRRASEQWREALARSNPELSYPSAAAGMYGTAGDFAHYLAEMVKSRETASAHLSEKLVKEMFTPQINITSDASWGLGWGILHTRTDDAIWHWGNWTGLYQHIAVIFKKEKAGVVILTNSGNGLGLCKKLVPEAIGLDIKPIQRFFE